jgi:UMF1 family MFS transporter
MFWVRREKKAAFAWALYDWANSAFSLTVMAFFFPVFFKTYYSANINPTQSSLYLGISNSLSALVLVILAPILGALGDAGSYKKNIVIYFTFFGSLLCVVLGLIDRGQAMQAAIVYGLCAFFHAVAMCPYDSLIVDVADESEVDMLSAWGYSLGYLGGAVLFILNLVMLQFPHFFGLSDKAMAIKVSFISVGIWWMTWTMPFILYVKEKRREDSIGRKFNENFKVAMVELRGTLKSLKKYKNVFLFLAAFFLYNDGVGTIIKMSVDYGMNLGFSEKDLGFAILLVQLVGFPLTLLFGKIARDRNPKTAILIGILTYAVVVFWSYRLVNLWEFYCIAVLIGVAQGGIQSVSRSMYARIIPLERAGEFFGFYNLLGKFTGLLGPVMVGLVGVWTGNARIGILSTLILFVAGAIIITRVNMHKKVAKGTNGKNLVEKLS